MFITIRSYNSCKKADYIKYRLERIGAECKIAPQEDENNENQEIYKVDVINEHVEKAVEELLKVHSEFPKEDFELKKDPNELLRILIPIDFSEKSIDACKFALDIAVNRPVEVKLIHIWNDELSDSVAVRSSNTMEDFKRMHRNEIKRDINNNLEIFRQKLNKLIADSNTQNNLLHHFTVTEGIVFKQVTKAVQTYKPQLVILGHNDHKEFKFRISRQVANAVIDLAICPVYYIPQKAKYIPISELHVMYSTNFSKNDLKSFDMMQQLSNGYDTHIHYLHITQEAEEGKTQQKMNDLLLQLKPLNTSNIKLHSNIVNNSLLLKGFKDYVENNKIDMISFSSPEYGMWHKLFNPDNLTKIMKGCSLPLLIFRYKENE